MSTPGSKIISFIKRKTSQKYRFDQQYEHNQWDGLSNIHDLGRYSIIVGYTKFFCPNARIIDLGCGEGILLERYAPSDYAHYLGVDISDVAINNARKKENSNARFITGDLHNINIDGTFDVIIYNESIYYLDNPKASVSSLIRNLNPDGIFIISTFNKHGKEYNNIWNALNDTLGLEDRTLITNGKGDTWTVHVYKIKR